MEIANGFDAMGKPIPAYRRAAAYETCKTIGIEPAERRFDCVDRMASALERDEPHRAMEVGMEYLDLTGTYRLMAVLLTAEKPRIRVKAEVGG